MDRPESSESALHRSRASSRTTSSDYHIESPLEVSGAARTRRQLHAEFGRESAAQTEVKQSQAKSSEKC